MKNTVLRQVFRVLAVALMVLIFVLSSRPIELSRQDSARAMKIFGFVDEIDDALDLSDLSMLTIHNAIRKFAHEIIFAALGGLVFLSIYRLGSIRKTAVTAFLISTAYGASDEIHQIFTNRGAMVSDVIRDSLGALAAVIFLMIFFAIVERNQKMKKFINIFYDLEAANAKNN